MPMRFAQSIIIYMKFQEENQSLFEVIQIFQEEAKLKKLMKKAQGLYLMHSFKIKFMTRKEASEFYFRFLNKYKSGELTIMANEWYKNERRLFLWYLVCYCEHYNVSIQNLGFDQWSEMGKLFFDKSPQFLKFQGLTIYKNIKKHNWNDNEDGLLEKFVKDLGTNQWNEVSKLLFFHNDKGTFISSKQCRERWFNHVCKQINKDSWTPEEDIEVLKLSIDMGKKWSAIARELKTRRTQHMVKNRYVSLINKARTNKKQSEEVLAKIAIKAIQQAKFNPNQKRKKSEQVLHSKGIKGEKLMLSKQLGNQNNSSLALNQTIEVEVSQKKQQFKPSLFFNSQAKSFDKEIQKFLLYSEEGGQKQIAQCGPISITPSTVKPIAVSPFTLFNNFDNFAQRFERKRLDGSNLFSPYPATPMPSLGPSPFVGYRSTLFSPVGVSELPFCDFRDKLMKKDSKDVEQGT